MSRVVLELTEKHLLLLKNLNWSLTSEGFIISKNDKEAGDEPEYTQQERYEEMDLILNGKPEIFDPLNTDEAKKYSQEEMDYFDKLLGQLPIALEIVLYNGSFELGTYSTRYNQKEWSKLN